MQIKKSARRVLFPDYTEQCPVWAEQNGDAPWQVFVGSQRILTIFSPEQARSASVLFALLAEDLDAEDA